MIINKSDNNNIQDFEDKSDLDKHIYTTDFEFLYNNIDECFYTGELFRGKPEGEGV